MKVIIMRHGDAVFSGGDRVLSERGVQEAKITGMKLVSSLQITRIFSSPKQRAMATAAQVKDLLRGRSIPEIEIIPELSPSGNTDMAVEYVMASCSNDDTVLLVSHIPQVVNLSIAFAGYGFNVPSFYTAAALVLQQDEAGKFVPQDFYTPSKENSF